MRLNHLQIQIRKVGAEARGSLDDDIGSTVVCNAKTSRNSIVLGEDRVRQSRRNIRNVVVHMYGDGRYIASFTVGGG